MVAIAASSDNPDVAAVIDAARTLFVAGERVEMNDLAARFGVSRATLFRWTGGKDAILAEVLWSLAEPVLDAAIRTAPGHGGERIAHIMSDFAAAGSAGFFHDVFVRREPARALRVMTTRAGGVQPKIVAKIEALLESEVAVGNLRPPLPLHDLAFLLVRITESFVYTDVLSGDPPDATKVLQACSALLGTPLEDPADHR